MIVQNTNTPPVSIIIPIWNEEGNILPLYKAIIETGISIHEFIFVDDGSTDQSLAQIETLSAKDPNVKAISFSRNFGHQAALIAGMHSAKAEVIIIMDGDLQHPPEKITAMVDLWRTEGVDIVEGVKTQRGRESFSQKLNAFFFYKIFSINFLTT